MLVHSISQIKNNKIQNNNTGYKEVSQKTVNNTTLPSFADAKSLANINFKGVIHSYAKDGYAYLVLEKIDEGVSVNDRGIDNNTPLIVACDNSQPKVVEKLLEYPDIDVNAQNVHGTTALMAACRGMSDNTYIAERLLNRSDIDVNIQNRDKNTALIWACRAGKTKIVEKLIDRPDIDVNAQNITGGTALMFAASFGFTDIVEKILQHPNVDVNLKDNKGKTALDFADSKIAGMINSYQKGVDKRELNKSNNFKIGVGINEYVAGVNKRDEDGNTALMKASIYGWTDAVKVLLANPEIDVNMQQSTGNTALMDACYSGHTEVVDQLLKHPEVNVNIQNREGFTALMYAAARKYTDIVDKLIHHPDINVNLRNNDGNTALNIAGSWENKEEVKKILLHPDVDVNVKNRFGHDVFYYANNQISRIIRGYKRGIDKRGPLIQKNVPTRVLDVNRRDSKGNTPLIWSSIFGKTEEVEELLQNPEVDINAQNDGGNTALMLACNNGQTKIVEKLLQQPDIDVNVQNENGDTALMVLAARKDVETVKVLLKHPNVNVNLKNKKDRSALFYANFNSLSSPECSQIVQMIKDYQKGVDKRNDEGVTVNVESKPKQLDADKLTSFKEIWTNEEKQNIEKMVEEKDYNALAELFEAKGAELNGKYEQLITNIDSVKEATEKSVRKEVITKIRFEEHLKAKRHFDEKCDEIDKVKTEYAEKNKALDNLINNYQTLLADDVEDAKSGFRALYGIKSEDLPDNMGLGEQMIYVIDILSKNKDKLTNMNGDSPEKITKTLQDNDGKISNDGLKFLERVVQVSDKTCSENDLISSINSVKDKNGHINMKKASYFIANLSWGQNRISDVVDKVERYNP